MLGNRVQNSYTEHVYSEADCKTMWRCRDTHDAVKLSSSDIIRDRRRSSRAICPGNYLAFWGHCVVLCATVRSPLTTVLNFKLSSVFTYMAITALPTTWSIKI